MSKITRNRVMAPIRHPARMALRLAVLLLCGLTIFGLQNSFTGIASAQDVNGRSATLETGHKAVITIKEGAQFPVVRKIKLGLDKSLLIELPVDLSDVLVSNPEVVDAVIKTRNAVYLLGKNVGEANAFFFDSEGRKVLYLDISVSHDLSSLADTLQRLIPGSSIKVEAMGPNVVLSGMVPNAIDSNRAAELAARYVKSIKNVVNILDVDSKEQVLLKVTVAEMQRNAIRRLGVDVPGAALQAGKFTFTKVIQNAFPITSSVVTAAGSAGGGLVPNVNGGSAFQSTWQSGPNSVTGFLQVLERRGQVRTLASPTLVAISGEEAKFLAGGEFPIPVSNRDGQITITYKKFGVSVAFKPVVLSGGRISLKVAAEVSELSTAGAVTFGNISIPALKVRRAETTLELASGGTLAMAGLLSDDTRNNIDGVPGLRNIPVLGALFRSTDYQKKETELVILVTPYIARNGSSRQEVALPDKGYLPEHELRELFLGRINRVYGRSGDTAIARNGDYGFIIEYSDQEADG